MTRRCPCGGWKLRSTLNDGSSWAYHWRNPLAAHGSHGSTAFSSAVRGAFAVSAARCSGAAPRPRRSLLLPFIASLSIDGRAEPEDSRVSSAGPSGNEPTPRKPRDPVSGGRWGACRGGGLRIGIRGVGHPGRFRGVSGDLFPQPLSHLDARRARSVHEIRDRLPRQAVRAEAGLGRLMAQQILSQLGDVRVDPADVLEFSGHVELDVGGEGLYVA